MIVFDLDDTLYKEIDFVKSATRAIAREIGHSGEMPESDALTILQESANTEKGLDNLAAELWIRRPDTQFTVPRMLEIYRTHQPDIHLPSGVAQMLELLNNNDVRLGLITDGRTLTQRAKIKALGIERYFAPENIIISEEIGAGKNSARPFRLIMERNVNEQKFTYVGDNPAKDFHWPNILGWKTAMLRDSTGQNIHSQLVGVTPDYRAAYAVDDFAELTSLLVPDFC